MSQFLTNIGYAGVQKTWAHDLRTTRYPAPKLPSSSAASLANSNTALPESTVSRHDLLALNAGIDDASRTANSLTTANDAISVIGGILQNIQTVLTASASSPAATVDPAIEQTRIDSAVSTIDAIASSTQFNGQRLLTGNFTISTSPSPISLPSFLSSALGSAQPVNANTSDTTTLASLQSGGANDLASGNLQAAGQIVAGALSQVAATQSELTSHLTASAGADATSVWSAGTALPGAPETADAMYLTASQMLNDASIAASAAANLTGPDVLKLLSS